MEKLDFLFVAVIIIARILLPKVLITKKVINYSDQIKILHRI